MNSAMVYKKGTTAVINEVVGGLRSDRGAKSDPTK